MHEEWLDLIPSYVAKRLPPHQTVALEHHLKQCYACYVAYEEWRAIAAVVRSEADLWSKNLPPLSTKARAQIVGSAHQNGYPQFDANKTQISPLSYTNIIYAPTVQASPKFSKERSRLPLRLVAAALAMVVFGGILLALFGNQRKKEDTQVMGAKIETLATSTPLAPTPVLSTTSTSSPAVAITPYPIGVGGGGSDALPYETQASSDGGIIELSIAQPGSPCVANNISGQNLSIYEWPDLSFNVVDGLQIGEARLVIAYSVNGWYELARREGGIAGWVAADQVLLSGICTQLALPTPTLDLTHCTVRSNTADDFLNIRAGPGQQYRILNTFYGPLEARARSNNDWFQVRQDVSGSTWVGWVPVALIMTVGACDTLPLVEAAGYPAEAAPVIFTPTPVP